MDVGTLFQKFLEQEKKKKRRHNDDDDDDAKLDAFFTTPPKTKRMSQKKRQCQIRKLMKQAKSIIEGISEGNNDDDDDDDDDDDKKIIGGGENSKKKRKKGGANVKENPLKKEIANPAGLNFANQVGALLAQPTKINMVPPADESRKSTQPEKIPFGVKTESKKVLEPKSNIFDINMQGRRSFTFECEGSFHNP